MAMSSRGKDDTGDGSSGTPEQIAYNLLRDIAYVEKREYRGGPTFTDPRISKSWILSTYRECLATVRDVAVKN